MDSSHMRHIKTNDFDSVKEWTSAVRYTGIINTSIQVMFRVQSENRIRELGISQEEELSKINVRFMKSSPRWNKLLRLFF